MCKVGILTFHYSNNYGGVLQALSLQKAIQALGYDVEVINFVPSYYSTSKITDSLGISKNIFKNKIRDINPIEIFAKISIINRYSKSITDKFDSYRTKEMILSERVDENTLEKILGKYSVLIVGSDQVWNPSQRRRPEYFMNFGNSFKGKKISYGADSTVEEVDAEDIQRLKPLLDDFSYLSVRNKYTFNFVKRITGREAVVVADPTIIYNLETNELNQNNEEYILTYILGREINGSHTKALTHIKQVHGDLPVYSIRIPTTTFQLDNISDKTFFDLGPSEWMNMVKHARFVYTDSYHGVLFSLKYNKPFLAYYTEKLRATRFFDLGERYNIQRYIVQDVDDINKMGSITCEPDFVSITARLAKEQNYSQKFLARALYSTIQR